MSAMGGAIPVRSSAEIDSGSSGSDDGPGGVVIPLPVERQASVEPSVELYPISPELALIDPELARAARALLPDRPRFAAVPVPLDEVVFDEVALVERLDAPSQPVRRGRLGRLLTLAGLLGLGVGLTLLVGPAPTQTQVSPQTRSAAGAERAAAIPSTPSPQAQRPATSAPSAPVHAAPLPGQTFVWVAAPGSSAYEFQLFRSGEQIYRARVTQPRLVLPGRWRQDGRPHALVPGDYRWYVWPVSTQTKRKASVATVQAKLVIEGQSR